MRGSWLRLFWLTVVLVGAVAGYLVSSGLGTRLLHREIETQLSRLLEGPVKIGEVDVHWADGLHVEAREVEAYPNPIEGAPPALSARRVLAWIDFVALLVGRLELGALTLEGPHLRIVHNRDGTLAGLPLPAIPMAGEERPHALSQAERLVAGLASLEASAAAFADRFRAADEIEVIDGTLSYIPPSPVPEENANRELRIELVSIDAERIWFSDAIDIEIGGVFVDGIHAPSQFEAAIRRAEDQPFSWSLSLHQIPLNAADGTLEAVDEIDGLTGTIDAQFRLVTEKPGVQRLSIDGQIADARIALRRSQTILEQGPVELKTELRIDAKEVTAVSSRFSGKKLGIDFKGSIRRPIRSTSSTRIESRVQGMRLEDIRTFARSLEGESEVALAVAQITKDVQSGRIRYVEAAGTTSLQRWQDLASGRVREIPSGFVLGGAFEQLTVRSGSDNVFENLSGEIEWTDDQLVYRAEGAAFRDMALPPVDVIVNGFSYLLQSGGLERAIERAAPPMPGIVPLLEIIRPRDPSVLPPVKAIALAIDHLEHPLLRFPVRDVKVLLEPLRHGIELNVREGVWGGAAVSGEVIWFTDPKAPSVSATLTLGPAPTAPEATTEGEGGESDPATDSRVVDRWGAGQFEVEFRPRARLPFQRGTGYFRLEDSRLLGDELEIQVENQGTIAARMTLSFESPDSVGFDTSFALTEGGLAQIGPFVALPAGLATGSIGATGSLTGLLRPHQSFIRELDGQVRAEAHEGQVYLKVPLMFRLAKATEGYNPFAGKESLQYEAMTGSFTLKQGVLSVEDFEIEGPLRVYARADLDTTAKPPTIRAIVGIFLFRKPTQILSNLPLVRSFLPGSERGLIGTYLDVKGPLSEPDVETLPLKTLMSGVPSAIKAPFKALGFLFNRGGDDS